MRRRGRGLCWCEIEIDRVCMIPMPLYNYSIVSQCQKRDVPVSRSDMLLSASPVILFKDVDDFVDMTITRSCLSPYT